MDRQIRWGQLKTTTGLGEGYTMGMEDCMDFSTLGGWIATRATSGKQARYGHLAQQWAGCSCCCTRGPMG